MQILRNRIRKLQDQENEINKKAGKLKEKFLVEQKLKSDKNEKKVHIINLKQLSDKMIVNRKQEIENLRINQKEEKNKNAKEHLKKNKVLNFIKLESLSRS